MIDKKKKGIYLADSIAVLIGVMSNDYHTKLLNISIPSHVTILTQSRVETTLKTYYSFSKIISTEHNITGLFPGDYI